MKNKENSLAVCRPDLAQQWHPWRNGDLKPEDVTCGSNKKVWWLLIHKDKNTGKVFNFEWETRVKDMVINRGCPFLTGRAVWSGFNDLATINTKLAKEWHPTKNGNLKPTHVTANSNKKVWWLLPYVDPKTGKEFTFEWESRVADRMSDDKCPFLSGKSVWQGFNDLATVNKRLAEEWHPTKNGSLKPTDITANSNKKVWWLLHYEDTRTNKKFDFEWQATVSHRNSGRQCPYLSNPSTAVFVGFNDLQTTHPNIAKEWNFDKNGELRPTDVTAGSSRVVWWKTELEGKTYEWKDKIFNRTVLNRTCLQLNGSYLEKLICDILKETEIEFEKEKSFSDCLSVKKSKLRYDFNITNLGFLIEGDGEQHFKRHNDFFGGKDGLLKCIDNDNIKTEYALHKNIPLLRVPYTYEKKPRLLKKIINIFINTSYIPQKIIDFYSQFEFSTYAEYAKEHNKNIQKTVS